MKRLTSASGGALALLEGKNVLCWDWAGRDKADQGDWEQGCELHLGMDATGTAGISSESEWMVLRLNAVERDVEIPLLVGGLTLLLSHHCRRCFERYHQMPDDRWMSCTKRAGAKKCCITHCFVHAAVTSPSNAFPVMK